MLGVRLPADVEEKLERHARATGRGKSVLAREWILEGLERESVDAEIRRAAELIARNTPPEEQAELEAMTADWLRALDGEDGGYDWGPEGPPA